MKLVVPALILLVFTALGLALAFDFRGVAREWGERSRASRQRVRRRDRTPEAARRSLAFATAMQRITGLLFALGSAAVLIAVLVTS